MYVYCIGKLNWILPPKNNPIPVNRGEEHETTKNQREKLEKLKYNNILFDFCKT